MSEYRIRGYDAFGNPVTETITIEPMPVWKRVLRRISRLFGYGRRKIVRSIDVRKD